MDSESNAILAEAERKAPSKGDDRFDMMRAALDGEGIAGEAGRQDAREGVSGEGTRNRDNGTYTIPPDIAGAINDATLLLVYLTGMGAIPRPEIVSAIFVAKKALETREWSVAIGTSFIEAFAEVSQLAKPITAKSVVESQGKHPRHAIILWSMVVYFLLPILVFSTAASFANTHFSDNVRALISLTYEAEKPDYLPAEAKANLASSATPESPTASPSPATPAMKAHNDAIRGIILEMKENLMWLVWLGQSGPQLDDLLKDSGFDVSDVQKTDLVFQLRVWREIAKVVISLNEIIFGVVNTYILPLLCALLGAAAYGLRSLTKQTQTSTYRVSYAVYARAVLAVIAGFAVGFFTKFTSNLSLEPIALGFLTGYGVESFFILLDTILQSVAKPTPQPAQG